MTLCAVENKLKLNSMNPRERLLWKYENHHDVNV